MSKKLTILLAVIVMMISGTNMSYAAFPLDAPLEKTATTINTARPDDEPKVKEATDTETKTADTNHKHKKHGKSQLVATILCFFVGVLGIHRFYLGYTWQGIVQLLTGGGLLIWTLIDFIRILINDLGPKDGKYEKTFMD